MAYIRVYAKIIVSPGAVQFCTEEEQVLDGADLGTPAHGQRRRGIGDQGGVAFDVPLGRPA